MIQLVGGGAGLGPKTPSSVLFLLLSSLKAVGVQKGLGKGRGEDSGNAGQGGFLRQWGMEIVLELQDLV